MTTFSVALDDAKARAMLDRVAKVGSGAKTMRAVSLVLRNLTHEAFRDGAANWPPLSPATLAARARKGNHSKQPLIATGAMYASIEASNTDTEASVSVGDGLPDARAWYNQFGTLRAPARPFLPITNFGTPNPTQAWLDAVMEPVRKEMAEAVEA